jgi:hypothetical protein
MKHLHFSLFLVLVITACEPCNYSSIQFTLNYKRDVVIPKQILNEHIGTVLHITQEFESGVAEQMETYMDSDHTAYWEINTVGLDYFWLELNGNSPANFDFLESALATCRLNGEDFSMTSLTFPEAGKTKFKISEVGTFRDRTLPGDLYPATFTVTVSLVPTEAVEEDLNLHWSFTLQYKASLEQQG